MLKEKNNRFIIVFIILFVLILCSILLSSTATAYADSGSLYLDDADKAILQHNRAASMDEDFEKDRLQIIIKHNYSLELNEKTALEQFKKDVQNLEIESIKGWVTLEEIKSNPLWDEDSFHQILDVYLIPSKQSKEKVLQVVEEFSKSNIVLAANPVYNYKPIEEWTPNDSDYSNQWGLHGTYGIDAPQAWDIERGNNAVRVGLFEDGAQKNHEDLNGIFLQENFTINPNNEHGTRVAGIIGAISDNGIGISGIADVQLLLLNKMNFTDSITHAANNNVQIINASFVYLNQDNTNASYNSTHAAAINNYKGLLICSAGNAGADNDNISHYPSDYSSDFDNVIAVGAIRSNGNPSTTSNYGANSVSLFAPGENILSTSPANIYIPRGGTSYAAPHVTGVAALLLSHNYTLTAPQLKSAILDSVTPVTALSGLCVTGGMLNAYEALRSVPRAIEVFNDFGYNGSTYYWNGTVSMTIDNVDGVETDSSGTLVFTEETMLSFELDTASHNNYISSINGNVTFQLTHDDTGVTILMEGEKQHVSTVSVSGTNAVSLGNTSFIINTANLLGNTNSYTLTLTSNLNRSSWNDTDVKTFTFIVENPVPTCVTEGTLITLADGSQKAVELLTMDDLLLVWDHHTGSFGVAPMVFIDNDPFDLHKIIHLYFSDGTEVKVVGEHGFWNATMNCYVFIRDNESTQYIGDYFNKQTYDTNGNMVWENVQLIDVQVYTEHTTTWSPVTFFNLNYYVNGMLSMPGATTGLINIFEVDEASMQYNIESFNADILTYGLFTYEEFVNIIPIPEVIFDAFNGQYLKVSIGKGLINIEELIILIDYYADIFPS